jgi:ParB family chromosome partitioning protein
VVKRRRIVPKKELPKAADSWVGEGGTDPEISRPIPSAGLKQALALDDIQDRAEDTRQLNEAHVKALAESITVLGLIEPLVTDKNYVLLAGGHRKAAIALIQDTNPEAYQTHFGEGIPVRVMAFDAVSDPEQALAIEVAENEQRRDYSPAEVKAIADRLLDAGFVEVKGRPKKDEKPLMPALSAVVGKSIRTLQRYLEEPSEEKSTTDVVDSDAFLKRAIANLKKWEQVRGRKRREVELSKNLSDILEQLESAIDDIK